MPIKNVRLAVGLMLSACATAESTELTEPMQAPESPPPIEDARPAAERDREPRRLDGDSVGRGVPPQVSDANTGWVPQPGARPRVVLGGGHGCVVRVDGTLACWGRNDHGQVGVGTTDNVLRPTTVAALSDVVEVALGDFHTCARLADGSIWCWGHNDLGQLGDGTRTKRLLPVAISAPTGVVQLALGAYHSCARLSDGTVSCWGNNQQGQAGASAIDRCAPFSECSTVPVGVPGISGAVELIAGGFHTCVTRGDGSVACFGHNEYGQRSCTMSSPHQIAAGRFHTCYVGHDGLVSCCGNNEHGQISTNLETRVPAMTAIAVEDVLVLGGAFAHNCALLGDQTVTCWGENFASQVGDGSSGGFRAPVAVAGLAGVDQLAVGGGFHLEAYAGGTSCALLADDRVCCWGANSYGQRGDGTTDTTPSFTCQ